MMHSVLFALQWSQVVVPSGFTHCSISHLMSSSISAEQLLTLLLRARHAAHATEVRDRCLVRPEELSTVLLASGDGVEVMLALKEGRVILL